MSRPVVLALLLLPLLAVAAPVPKRKPAFGPLGDFTDPKTKCKAEFKDASLTVTVPTDQPAVDAEENGAHLPVLARSVEGDFTLTVRMTQTLGDNPRRASPKMIEAAATGLAVFAEGHPELAVSAVILRRPYGKDEWPAFQHIGWSIPKRETGRLVTGSWTKAGQPAYLRLTRHGKDVSFEESKDGEKWWPMGSKELEAVMDLEGRRLERGGG